MVFNWFNRFKKQEKKPEPEPMLPEAPLEVSPPPEEAEPYYMQLAREIQRKEEQKLEELPVAVSTSVPEVLTSEAPTFESQKLEESQKVELNEDIFDWQKLLYGSTPAPIVEKRPEPVAEAPIPVLEKPPETFPLPTPVQEPTVQPPITASVTPTSAEPEIELPIMPIVEAAISSETVVEQPLALDWQKILYGSTPAPVPIVEKLPEPVVEAPIPVLEPVAEAPIPVLEKLPETFPLLAPVQEPIAESIVQLPTPTQDPLIQPLIVAPFTPVIAEPEVELPVTPIAEAAVSIETVVEQSPVSSIVESLLPIDEKPLEAPASLIDKPLETIAEVLAPPIEPTTMVPEVPVLEPIAKADPPSTPTTEPEPAPQSAPAAIPFWKRVLGQRAFDPQTPALPTPTPEVQTPSIVEVPPPVLPAEQAIEVLPEPPVILPPPPASPVEPEPSSDPEAVPFWKRMLGQRPTTTPTPEVPPAPREKPTVEPQLTQFDVGFLWSAEVLAAQGRRPEDVTLEEISWLQKLRLGLGRTRRGLVNNIKAIVGRGPLGPQEIEELEELLLQADVGIGVSEKILESLQARVRQEALPPDQTMTFLKNQLRQQVELKGDDPAKFAPLRDQLNIWLVVGVNGVGKTTTIGKLASLASRSGYRTMIAAGDTFRAGAVSQVQIWAQRSNVPVISNPSPNADPASVVFDAIGAARARNIELLIVDTAGRLQNKKNLMDELAKIRRIIDKQGAGAHVESLLVLDSTTGQNGLQQAKVFTEVASLTGVVLTKLDGSSKGGIALAIVDELKLPIRFVGVGEKVDDLRPFNSYEFIEALLSDVED
jgi:fused signal recognition particle receptor